MPAAATKCPVCNSAKMHVNKGSRARWVCQACGSSGEKSVDLGMIVFQRADMNRVSRGSGRRILRGR